MSMRMKVDRARFEEVAEANRDVLLRIAERGRAAGAIHHLFAAGENGEIVVIDEWESREQFERFFEEQSAEIGGLMQQAGVQGEPAISFFEPLATADAF